MTRGHSLQRGMLALAGMAVLALALAAPAQTAAPDLPAYVKAMQTLNTERLQTEAKANATIDKLIVGNQRSATKVATGLRLAKADLWRVYLRAKATKHPAGFAGPHAAYVTSLKLEAGFLLMKAEALEKHGDDAQALLKAIDAMEPRNRRIHALRRQWRDETVSALRRLGLVVPLWVKQAG